MDRHLYKFILESFLWPTVQNYNSDPGRLVFQPDNDPKHTSKIMQECLASQSFQLLQWLAQFPNMNPIEHLRALLKQRLNELETPPRGIQELWERVCTVYPNSSEHDCMAFYESMPQRIDVVLKSRGYRTNYY